jgi:hypothetical protein
MVRYRVKPDQVATNEELVRAVYEELRLTQPSGFRYATFKLDDGVSFAHIAMVEGGGNPLAALGAFQAFQKGVEDRCDEAPVVTELEQIGSFGL